MQYIRLKNLREDNDLYQKDIANILKITRQQYSLYEIGKREIPAEFLNILANFYKTSVDYLMGRTNIKEPYPKKK